MLPARKISSVDTKEQVKRRSPSARRCKETERSRNEDILVGEKWWSRRGQQQQLIKTMRRGLLLPWYYPHLPSPLQLDTGPVKEKMLRIMAILVGQDNEMRWWLASRMVGVRQRLLVLFLSRPLVLFVLVAVGLGSAAFGFPAATPKPVPVISDKSGFISLWEPVAGQKCRAESSDGASLGNGHPGAWLRDSVTRLYQ